MKVAPGCDGLRVEPTVESVAVGVAVYTMKKPSGQFSVTAEGPEPPAVGVKVNVAAEPAFPATRSPAATLNVTDVTAPPITPEAAATDAVTSTLVCTVTSPPAVAAPMVKL
jgi:hypothetical protein